MVSEAFIEVADQLSRSGLVWRPEIGDEIALRPDLRKVSILFDPQGLVSPQLHCEFLWLPSVEQMVEQIEARQGLICHVGINEKMYYEAVVKTVEGVVSIYETNLRLAMGRALYGVLNKKHSNCALQ